jgi:hypothetical protein
VSLVIARVASKQREENMASLHPYTVNRWGVSWPAAAVQPVVVFIQSDRVSVFVQHGGDPDDQVVGEYLRRTVQAAAAAGAGFNGAPPGVAPAVNAAVAAVNAAIPPVAPGAANVIANADIVANAIQEIADGLITFCPGDAQKSAVTVPPVPNRILALNPLVFPLAPPPLRPPL